MPIDRKYLSREFLLKNGDPPPLIYGVDFNKTALDRDRRSLMTGAQVASTLAEMWDDLMVRDGNNCATELYLKCLLEKDNSLETMKAIDLVSLVAAKKLLELLRSFHSEDTFYYNAEGTDSAEVYLPKADLANFARQFE